MMRKRFLFFFQMGAPRIRRKERKKYIIKASRKVAPRQQRHCFYFGKYTQRRAKELLELIPNEERVAVKKTTTPSN